MSADCLGILVTVLSSFKHTAWSPLVINLCTLTSIKCLDNTHVTKRKSISHVNGYFIKQLQRRFAKK